MDGQKLAHVELLCRSQKYSFTILYLWIIPQILLEPHQQHGNTGAEVLDLLDPALRNVLQAVRARDGEAEQQHVRVGVRERPQSANITSITQMSSP